MPITGLMAATRWAIAWTARFRLPFRPVMVYLGLALAVGIGVLTRDSWLGAVVGVLFLAAGGFLLFWQVARRDSSLYALLVWAFVARLLVVLVDTRLEFFPKLDAIGYHLEAKAFAESWRQEIFTFHVENPKTAAYELTVAPFYFVFGSWEVLARTLNSIVGTLAVFNVFRIGRWAFGPRTALLGAGAFAFLPTIVMLHGEHLRDALIAFVFTELVYVGLRRKPLEPESLAAIPVGLAFLSFLRAPMVFILLATIPVLLAFAFAFHGNQVLEWLHRRQATASVVLGLTVRRRLAAASLLLLMILVSWRLVWMRSLFVEWFDPHVLTVVRSNWATGGSSYFKNISFDSWLDVLFFAPVGMAYFLLTPFPWQVHNLFSLLAVIENLILFYPVVLIALPAMKRRFAIRRSTVLLLLLITSSVLFGLVEGNAGTALRHRSALTWIIFLFAGVRLSVWWSKLERGLTSRRTSVGPTLDATRSPSPPS